MNTLEAVAIMGSITKQLSRRCLSGMEAPTKDVILEDARVANRKYGKHCFWQQYLSVLPLSYSLMMMGAARHVLDG